jgi:antitoxin (DNA-binding transcriptional repressor) of toxin-antitoxin stability system
MVTIAIEQLEQNPLEVIRRVEAGETIEVLRNNKPVAQISPSGRRPAGLCKGQFTVPADIAEPLPPEVLKDFEGT